MNLYEIGNNFHSARLLKKYACFLDESNRGSFENGSRNKYKRYLEESNRKRKIEYLLFLLEGFIEEDNAPNRKMDASSRVASYDAFH